MREDGKIDYVELPGGELAPTKRFYEAAFGWTFTDYGPSYAAFEEGVDGGFDSDAAGTKQPLVVLYAHDLEAMVAKVSAYVPGYRLKQRVQFEVIPEDKPVNLPGIGQFSGLKTAVYLEVEGAAHYLPAYAGNLDIMTSSALATAEKMAQSLARQAGEAA